MKTVFLILIFAISSNCWANIEADQAAEICISSIFPKSDTLRNSFIIQGKVTDTETNESIIFGTVAIYRSGNLVAGTETDFDGNYSLEISGFEAQSELVVDIEYSYIGYQTQRIEHVALSLEKANKVDAQISDDNVELELIPYCNCSPPIISADDFLSGQTLYSDQISRRANRRN